MDYHQFDHVRPVLLFLIVKFYDSLPSISVNTRSMSFSTVRASKSNSSTHICLNRCAIIFLSFLANCLQAHSSNRRKHKRKHRALECFKSSNPETQRKSGRLRTSSNVSRKNVPSLPWITLKHCLTRNFLYGSRYILNSKELRSLTTHFTMFYVCAN